MDLESVGVKDRYRLLGALQHSSTAEQLQLLHNIVSVNRSKFVLTSLTTTVVDRLRLVISY